MVLEWGTGLRRHRSLVFSLLVFRLYFHVKQLT